MQVIKTSVYQNFYQFTRNFIDVVGAEFHLAGGSMCASNSIQISTVSRNPSSACITISILSIVLQSFQNEFEKFSNLRRNFSQKYPNDNTALSLHFHRGYRIYLKHWECINENNQVLVSCTVYKESLIFAHNLNKTAGF